MRPAFTVSSGVMALLAALAVVTVNQRNNIPPRPPNGLVHATDPFLWQARFSPVDWQRYGDRAFLSARQSGRPILLFIGSPFSAVCRSIDRAFEDDSLAAYVQRNFVPIRIDGRLRPEWATALLPIQQLQAGNLPGSQLWVLDPQGRIVDGLLQTDGHRASDPDSLLQALIEASHKYESRGEEKVDLQANDREAMLIGGLSPYPDLPGYAARIHDAIAAGDGRMLSVDQQEPLASMIRFLVVTGRHDDLQRYLDRIIASNLYDGLDGGFYRSTRGENLELNNFDKDTAENAELAVVIAAAANLERRADWRKIAAETFDWVMAGYEDGSGLSPGRISDSGRDGRSERSSIRNARIRDFLSVDQTDFARTAMCLEPRINPLMSPRPARPEVVLDPRWDEIRHILRAGAKPPNLVRMRILAVEGHAAARLLQAARILNDPVRLRKAIALSETLADYREGADLSSRTGEIRNEPATLHGYLAYADDGLQDYLSTGNVPAFERGYAVLERGLKKFAAGPSGAYLAFLPDPAQKLGIKGADVPQIEDAWVESLSARGMRLLHAYGRLLRPQPLGIEFEKSAEQILERFALLAPLSKVRTAAYFAVAGSMVDDDFAVAVGPNALELAREVEGKCPGRLVAPAYGPIRPDIQKRPPGLYIVRGARIDGPLTPDGTAAALNPTLRLGLD